jgi:putative nucleotidyltransferase with HDIG domain
LHDELTKLMPEFELVENPDLRAGCLRVWATALDRGGWTPDDLCRMPFTLLIPQDAGVSLLDHTRAVTKVCAAAYETVGSIGGVRLNRDLLVAGALLHDVGKVMEMQEADGTFSKSPDGKLIRHPFSGAALCLEEGLPAEVAHIVAMHAKEGDHSRRIPEAVIVHYADFMAFLSLKSSLGL